MVVEKLGDVSISNYDMSGELGPAERQELNIIAQSINDIKNNVQQLKQNYLDKDIELQIIATDIQKIQNDQENIRQHQQYIDEIYKNVALEIQENKEGSKKVREDFNLIERDLNELKKSFDEIRIKIKNLDNEFRQTREESEKILREMKELRAEFRKTNEDTARILEDYKQISKDYARIREVQDKIEEDHKIMFEKVKELKKFYGQKDFFGDVKKKLAETFQLLNQEINPPLIDAELPQVDGQEIKNPSLVHTVPVIELTIKNPVNQNFREQEKLKVVKTVEVSAEIPKKTSNEANNSIPIEAPNKTIQVINVKKVNPKSETQIKKEPSKLTFLATIKKTINAFIKALINFLNKKKQPNHNLLSHSIFRLKTPTKKSSILQKNSA